MKNSIEAVCVFNENGIQGNIILKEDLVNKLTAIYINLQGVKPGYHGIHIHRFGDLREGCQSVCEHYNPYNKNHGGPGDIERHVGDLGNILANKKGIIKSIIYDKMVKLRGKYSVIGRSIVIHENIDDLGRGGFKDSKTTGHSGKRIACDIIGYSKNNII